MSVVFLNVLASAAPAAPGAEEASPPILSVEPTPASPVEPEGRRSPLCCLGLRVGYADFASSEGGIGDGLLVGLFVDGASGGRVACETGLDYAKGEAADGSFTSSQLCARFDILLPAGSAEPRVGGYFFCGAAGVAEVASDESGRHTNYVGMANLGAGFGVAEGRFDLRFTYSAPLGSRNASAMTLVSLGMRF